MMSGLAAREATSALSGVLPAAAGKGGNPFASILSGMLPGEASPAATAAAPASATGLPTSATAASAATATATGSTEATLADAGSTASATASGELATPVTAAATGSSAASGLDATAAALATPVTTALAGMLSATTVAGSDSAVETSAEGSDSETAEDDPLTAMADDSSSAALLPGHAALTPALTHAAPLQLAGHPAAAALAQAVARAGGQAALPADSGEAPSDKTLPDGLLKASLQQAVQAQQNSSALAAHGAAGALGATGNGHTQAASVASLNAAPAWLSVLRDAMSSGQPVAASALDGMVAGETGGSPGLSGEFSLRLAQPAVSRELPVFTLAPNAQQDTSAWTAAFNQRLTLMAQQGMQQASLTMNPVDLGPIEVHLSMADDVARVQFSAQHAATQDLIESALPRLAQAFEAQGMRLEDARVSAQPLRADTGFLAQAGGQSSGQQLNQGQNQSHSASAQAGGQGGDGRGQAQTGQTGQAVGSDSFLSDTSSTPASAIASADGAVDYYA